MFPAKINDKNFKINKKNPFLVVILAQREFFYQKHWLSITAVVPCHLKVKDTEQSEILFHHYQHVKIIQSICSIHLIICDIPCLRIPQSLRPCP